MMTQHGTYNEAFWVAVAAAAPVIALASTVQFTDIQKLFIFTLKEAQRFPWRRYISLPVCLSTVNIVAQIIAMYCALTSIARHDNFLNLSQAIILEIAGMAIIVAVAYIAVLGQMEVNKFKQILGKEKLQAAASPSDSDGTETGQAT